MNLVVALHHVIGQEANAQASPHRLPLHDQVVAAQGKGFAGDRKEVGLKAAQDVFTLVVADHFMLKQVLWAGRYATPGQVVTRRISADAHLANLSRDQTGLGRAHHSQGNIGLAPQQVADGVAGFEFDLNVGQGFPHRRQHRRE